MLRSLFGALLVVTGLTSPTRAQSWTLAPTVSFGYGWVDGQYDYVGDETYCQGTEGVAEGGGWQAASPPPFTCWTPEHYVAPYGGAGVTLVRAWSRVAWTGSLDLTLGSTHRIGDSTNSGPAFRTVGEGDTRIYLPALELSYRIASTGRLRLGTGRRGYLGAGARLGYRMQVGRGDEVGRVPSPNPDVQPPSGLHFPRGFTTEALVEGGAEFGPATLGVVVGAGRPRFRAEVVMSFPIDLGAD